MKKAIAAIAALLMLSGGLSVQAATPSYTAKHNTPAVDGVVNSSEYGAPVAFDKSNLSLFYYNSVDKDPTGAKANFPECTYAFAWNEAGLHVGIIAKNIQKLTDTQFQIDLSPEKKIKDGKKGIFYTFKVIQLGENGMVSVARNNFQTGGSNKLSVNITNQKGVKAVAKEASKGVYHIEAVIPLAELRVTGTGGNFSALNLKAGAWGIGCYLVGNGGGYTNTQGATNPRYTKGLVEYYNPLTLQEKSVAVSSQTGEKTSTAQKPNSSTAGPAISSNTSRNSTVSSKNTSAPAGSAVSIESTASDDTASAGTTGENSEPATEPTPSGESRRSDPASVSAAGKENEDKGSFAWLFIAAAAIILAGAGAAVYIVLKKKKNVDSSMKERSDENGKK